MSDTKLVDDETQKKGRCSCCNASEEQTRRNFCLSALGLGLGAVALAAPTYAGAKMVLFPLSQEGLSGKEYQLSTIDALDETPRMFVITDSVTDAWTTSANQTIGAVYLFRKTNEDGTTEAVAFQSVCPHAGCRVKAGVTKNPDTGEQETLFHCPCHGDVFYLNGERVLPQNSKSARSLDSLETRVDENGRVFVKFQNFQLGIAEKKSV